MENEVKVPEDPGDDDARRRRLQELRAEVETKRGTDEAFLAFHTYILAAYPDRRYPGSGWGSEIRAQELREEMEDTDDEPLA